MLNLFANKRFLLIALIFLLLTWVMFVTSRERPQEGKVEYFFNTAIAPLETIFNSVGRVISDSWQTVTKLGQLKVENERLQKKIANLKVRQLELESLQEENILLREALDFKNSQTNEIVVAEVIAVNPNNWNHTLTINKGSYRYGLEKNMAVISPNGVVGRIGEVRPLSAEVILLNDARDGNYIGGVIARTGSMVIVSGGGEDLGYCTVKPAIDSYFADLKMNDLVVTAATSNKFPKGIPIGKIVNLNKGSNDLVSKASLKPAVNLSQLKIVYVIKTKQENVGLINSPESNK